MADLTLLRESKEILKQKVLPYIYAVRKWMYVHSKANSIYFIRGCRERLLKK